MKQPPLEPRKAFDSLLGNEEFVYLKRQSLAESTMRSRGILGISLFISFSYLLRVILAVALPGTFYHDRIDIFIFAFLFFIVLGFASYRFIQVRQENSAIGLTSQAFYYRHGFINGQESMIRLEDIKEVKSRWQDFHARKHNYGKLHFIPGNGPKIIISSIEDPEKIKNTIEHCKGLVIPSF